MDPTLNSETKGSFASETVSLNSDSQARVVLGEKTSFAANVESHDQIVPLPPKTDETLAYNEISWQELMTTCIPIALICLLVWLDEGILATAIPRISDEFNSFDQIGWYGPSYLFGLCASQLPFGKAYKDCSPKVVYLISLLIFEVGSILQAAAPSSEAFIVGRVFAGIGGAGVLAGSLTIFSEDIPKAKLPYVMGTFGLVHSAGGVAGPVIGGAITSSSLTWRWCFYLNPIVSAASLIPILFIWKGKLVPILKDEKALPKQILLKLDYLGTFLFGAAVVALLLALQFGGSSYSWSDTRTIATLTAAGILFLGFVAIERWKGVNAIVPGKIAGRRVVVLSSIYTATLDGAYFILTYQIPLWFQSISGLSARASGYHILPLVAACIVATMTATLLTGKLHYYHPFMLLGAVLLTIGSGLLTTLHPGTSWARWVLFQILAGAGTGLGTSLPLLAVQDALQPGDVPIGYAVVLTAGYLASSIALAIAQALFASRLKSDITQQLPGIDPHAIINAGATDLEDLVPSKLYDQVVQLYNKALTESWYIAVVLSSVSVFLVLGFKWKKMDMRDNK